jgi:hypothetical protein
MKPPPPQTPALNPRDLVDGEQISIVDSRLVNTPHSPYHPTKTIATLSDGRKVWIPDHILKNVDGTLNGDYTVVHIEARGKPTIALRNR